MEDQPINLEVAKMEEKSQFRKEITLERLEDYELVKSGRQLFEKIDGKK